MKIIRGFKIRGFILAAAFSAGLGFATSASAQVHLYLVDLNSKTGTDIGSLAVLLVLCLWHQRRRASGGLVYTLEVDVSCFHHRPERDGHERPWHFGGCLQRGLWA